MARYNTHTQAWCPILAAWVPVRVPSLGERFGLLFPSVSRSCRLNRTLLAWYNTHTQVWCPILAAWLGDQFGSSLGDQFGCRVWVTTFLVKRQERDTLGKSRPNRWLGTTLTHRFGVPFRLPGWVTSLVPVWATGLGDQGWLPDKVWLNPSQTRPNGT